MKYSHFALVIWFSIILTTGAIAGDPKSGKPMSPEEMMEVYTKLATPGEQHKLLASLTGSWVTKTKEWMDPHKPPVESTGSVNIKMLLEGRFLQQEITGSMHGKPHTGIWTIAYDNLLKQYVSTWIDSMSTGIFTMEGTATADGKTITLTGRHAEAGGGHMSHRAIWTIVDSNNQEFIMYGTHHGGEEMKMLEVIYTRKQ
ncbi:MAG: DUF1579 domain-containing protein [Nitrosomonas sp.]|nr:MAG: DUF1579 domain-containing protein [Nitrosomonas sp.]